MIANEHQVACCVNGAQSINCDTLIMYIMQTCILCYMELVSELKCLMSHYVLKPQKVTITQKDQQRKVEQYIVYYNYSVSLAHTGVFLLVFLVQVVVLAREAGGQQRLHHLVLRIPDRTRRVHASMAGRLDRS